LGSRRRFGQILPAYHGRMEAILRRSLRKGLGVFKAFLRASSIPLHQVTLRTVLDYLTHLYDCGLLWSSIGIHRSTIFMMMAPIDGANIGDHPLVKRLMSGIFNERPSRRANPESWDPLGLERFYTLAC
jgi:hypothetical protein